MIRRPPRSTQSRSSAASDVYKRQLYYTEFPHNLSFKNQSLFGTPGSESQTFSGNGSTSGVTDLSRWGSQSFDYKIRRKDAGGSFDLSAVKPFFISVEANQLKREGQIPWAGNSGQASFKAVEFALPVDNTTTNISAVSYTHLRAHETRHDLVCRLL